MRLRTLVAAVLAGLALAVPSLAVPSLAVQPVAAAREPRGEVEVLGVASTPDREVSLVAAVRPAPASPLGRDAVTVLADGWGVPATVRPILSDRTAVALVVDGSAAGAPALHGGGLAGAASLLLQLPAGSTTAVVVDRRRPTVAASTSVETADAVRAVSALRSRGPRATSEALTLAVRQLPESPGPKRVVVLYTAAANAGEEAADVLAERLRAAGAVLAVVTTNRQVGYWSQVAAATGGLAVVTEPARAIRTFDEVRDALAARYEVAFVRPPDPVRTATLRIHTAGARLEATIPLPLEAVTQRVAARSPAGGPPADSPRPWVWAVALLVAVGGAVMLLVRRRPAPTAVTAPARMQPPVVAAGRELAPPPAEEGREAPQPVWLPISPSGLPGVRVFDVGDPVRPREITNPLFEERRVRDARETAQAAEEASENRRRSKHD